MAVIEQETENFLDIIAETLLAHRKWFEQVATAEEKDLDSEALYQLSEAYLILYSLYKKGDIPRVQH